MLNDLKLRKPELSGEIWVCPTVQEVILDYRQTGFLAMEAGGILLGYRRGPHIEVVEATSPMALDVRRRHSFERKDPGHQAFSDIHWEVSGGTMNYLGEWHTHPEVKPSPSHLDRSEWGKLMNRYADPLIFIIAGTVQWYIEFGSRTWTIPAPSPL